MNVIALQISSWILPGWVVWVSKSYLKYHCRNQMNNHVRWILDISNMGSFGLSSKAGCLFWCTWGKQDTKIIIHLLILLYSFLELISSCKWLMVFIKSWKYTFLKFVQTYFICISIFLKVACSLFKSKLELKLLMVPI